eukprot:SAG22_NODE_3435_length_1714_cov_1.137461_2_plen_170_part_00
MTACLLKAAEGGNDATKRQIDPRGQSHNEANSPCAAGAAFSNDRLFVLWKSGGGVTVHDPTDDALKVLRTLPFTGGNQQGSNYQLACTGGLLAAAAGGGDGSQPRSIAEEATWQTVQLWRVDAVGETELQTVKNPDQSGPGGRSGHPSQRRPNRSGSSKRGSAVAEKDR